METTPAVVRLSSPIRAWTSARRSSASAARSFASRLTRPSTGAARSLASPYSEIALRSPAAIPASALPVSLCSLSVKSTNATATIGTITMIVKKTKSLPLKLMQTSCLASPG